jgi:hypothetical protein
MDSIVRAAHHWRMRTASAVVIAVVAFLSTGGAGAAPASFQLVFDGKHNGLLHEGTFTTSSSFCHSGTAADVSVEEQTRTALRRFSCDTGSGFTAKVRPLPAEHGGSGSWQIVAGTGPLADLRGKGTFTSVLLTGDPNDPPSITFRSTWKGVADFDTAPPTIGLRHWSAKKLKRPKGVYRVKLALSLADNGGAPVSYLLQLAASSSINFTQGRATTGSVTRSLRIKLGTHTRRVRLTIEATDAVGNQSSFAKTLRLKR